MSLGDLLVLVGVILAIADAFFANRVRFLLHLAVVLIGIGLLLGADGFINVNAD